MKAIFINIAADKAGAIEQRNALPALRKVVAVHEVTDARTTGIALSATLSRRHDSGAA